MCKMVNFSFRMCPNVNFWEASIKFNKTMFTSKSFDFSFQTERDNLIDKLTSNKENKKNNCNDKILPGPPAEQSEQKAF